MTPPDDGDDDGLTEEDFILAVATEVLEQELIEAKLKRTEGRLMLKDYVERRNPSLFRFEHIPKLIDVGQRILDGEIRNTMILLPTRYFKSEVFSRLLTSAYLRRFPHRMAAINSYSGDLAWELSGESRNYFVEDGGRLAVDVKGRGRWATHAKGQLWATGVGGPALGRGFHLGVIDDPTDPEKAHSPAHQKKFEMWFPSKFLSRREPGAQLVFVMQRLGVDDPVDFLFRREVGEHTDLAPLNWHVVVMDEIRSDEPLGRWSGPMGLPPTCTVEFDDRPLGQVLSPSRFSEEEVKDAQRTAGSYVASSQRQQRPAALTGDFWDITDFRTYDDLPADAYNGGKDWDTAYGSDEVNSASGYVESFRGPGAEGTFPVYIHDVDWDWKEFPELVTWMTATPGPHYIEEKATGKSAHQALTRLGIASREVPVAGDKFTRSTAVQPVVTTRRVWVRREIMHRLFWGERQGLARVTAEGLLSKASGLDVNDMFVQALQRHCGRRPAPRASEYKAVRT